MAYVSTGANAGANRMAGRPGVEHAAVTPHDSNNFAHEAMGLFVGTGGTVPVVSIYGTVVDWVVPDGTYIDMRCKRVNSTGLVNAANIVAIFG